MNLPNFLTISRIVFAIAIIVLIEKQSLVGNVAVAVVFTIACLTDLFDGYLARKMNLVSDFGKIMDPIADKILILSIFGVLAYHTIIPWWVFAVIAVREILVTTSRLLAMRKGQILAAERAGKIKTVTQIITIYVILVFFIVKPTVYSEIFFDFIKVYGTLLLITVVLTVYSGLDYFYNKWKRERV